MDEDTITAVATALGEGAIGIIRVSGAQALAIGEELFHAASKKRLGLYAPNTLAYGYVLDSDGNCVDEVLAVYMRSPHTYTGEDVVEIQCHGGRAALEKILSLTFKAGARLAEPGEFTKRAFLNGRIDLTQAEAVMDIIRSRSEVSLKLAVRQQQGVLARKVRSARARLLALVAQLEAGIDYPEDDIEEVTMGQVKGALGEITDAFKAMLATSRTGRLLREGLRTAIVGRPNVGKSSLLNALLKEERAIVSSFAGTTRDIIEEQLLIGGVPIVLADTAGIRATDDYVEKIGVVKSREFLAEADLAICVIDASNGITEEDEQVLKAACRKPCIIAANKSDLGFREDLEALKERFGALAVLKLSAKTGEGIDELIKVLKDFVYGKGGQSTDGLYIQNARQEELLRLAEASLEEALRACSQALPYDCIVIDIRLALAHLGEITGDTASDEILNEIFSRFCVGK